LHEELSAVRLVEELASLDDDWVDIGKNSRREERRCGEHTGGAHCVVLLEQINSNASQQRAFLSQDVLSGRDCQKERRSMEYVMVGVLDGDRALFVV
jgi:hypothetical protein